MEIREQERREGNEMVMKPEFRPVFRPVFRRLDSVKVGNVDLG